MTTFLVPKGLKKFHCLCCDFNTSRFSQYQRHIETIKHKRLQNTTNTTKKFQKVPNLEVEIIEKKYECDVCNKKYMHHSSLWKHKQTCNEYLLETEKKEPSIAGLDANFLKFVLENNTENIKILSNITNSVSSNIKREIEQPRVLTFIPPNYNNKNEKITIIDSVAELFPPLFDDSNNLKNTQTTALLLSKNTQ
jgi:hypothetical protein